MTAQEVAVTVATTPNRLSPDSRQDIALTLLQSGRVFASVDDGVKYAMRALSYQHKRKAFREWRLRRALMLAYPTEIERAKGDIADRIGLHQALDSMPSSVRAVIRLYYWQDMTIREIADRIGTSDSMVSMTLTRARRWIRERIDK